MKKGYKQTEIGIIPEDWEVEPLKKYCKSSAFGPRFSGDLYGKNGNVATLRTTDLDLSGNINYSTMPFAHLDESKFKDHLLLEKDFLITRSGTCGIAAVFKSFEKPVLPGAFLIRFRFKNNLDVQFLKFYVNSPFGQRQMEQIALGAVQKNISGTSLLNTYFPIPALPEQTAIAEALSDTDELATTLEKLIEKKKLIKKGTMQELLTGKKRLPGFEKKRGYRQTDVGLIPEDWEVKKLGDVATLKARIGWQGLTTSEYRKTGDFFLITGTEFKNGYIDWANCFFVDRERYIQDKNIQVKEHDVLVTKDGTIGKVAFIKYVPLPSTLNSGVFVIRPLSNSFHPKFFYYLLRSDIFKIFLTQLSAGSTINHLYQKDFVFFNFQTPSSLPEQTAIAETLSDMDSEIEMLEKKLEKTKQIKQGMMQELLTGKTRIV